MSSAQLILLAILFFLTSLVGVVTGSNSLITVPVMFQFGIDEKVAVATNMFGLTFMAVGGTIPFLRQGRIDIVKVSPMIALTAIGSALGALLVGLITNQGIKLVVLIAMIAVTAFTLFNRNTGRPNAEPSTLIAYPLVFLLAIYGGLYSGGYVTILTAVLVAFSGMTFGESIASTKLLNVFSSGIATLVFMWQGLVDYWLGIILGIAMFAGAYVGAHYATKMDDVWLRRIFVTTVIILAMKTIIDFL
jgi:uncharacterized membrane protein YfcA